MCFTFYVRKQAQTTGNKVRLTEGMPFIKGNLQTGKSQDNKTKLRNT